MTTQTQPETLVFSDDIYDPEEQGCDICKEKGRIVESTADGDMVCLTCGQIVGERIISEESEWRTFEGDGSRKDDPQRTGGPENPLLAATGLSTVIGRDPRNPLNDTLSRNQSRDSLDSRQRTLTESFRRISHMAGLVSLPNAVAEKAKEVFKRVIESGELKNRKTEALQAVCLYMSWKMQGVPRTLKDLCNATGVKKRDVSRLYTKIKKLKLHKKGGLSGKKEKKNRKAEQLPQSAVLINRFCSDLGLGHARTVVNAATEIAKRVSQQGLLEGKQPQTIAGAAIFMVSQLYQAYAKTFQQIADVAQINPGTIRQAFHALHERRMSLVPDDIPRTTIEALPLNPVGA